ncbi:MAG: hypothetical protein NTZ26_11555 [Candidatus Aminicenantes bacterium]|nr:hypothetical protein [Candidatus Aminicenantes bacterium]
MTKRSLAATATLALLGLLWLSSPAIAAAQDEGGGASSKRQGSFEIIYGRFSVKDPLFTEVYSAGGSIQGLGITAALFLNIDFYLEAKAFYKKGQLTFTKESTSFLLLPFSVGFRWRAPLGLIEPFVGAGLDYDVYYEKNAIGTALDYAKGTHVLAGVSLRPGRNSPIALTGRLRYAMVKAEHAGVTIDLGGLEAGASLSLIF